MAGLVNEKLQASLEGHFRSSSNGLNAPCECTHIKERKGKTEQEDSVENH